MDRSFKKFKERYFQILLYITAYWVIGVFLWIFIRGICNGFGDKFRFAWIYYDPCIPTPIPLWVIYFIFPFTLKGYLKLEICLQKIWNNKIISKIFPLDDAQELIFFQCEEERKLIKSGWLNSDRQKKAKSIELRRGLALSLEIDHFGEVISLVVMEGDIEAEMLAKKMARRMNSIWQNKYLSVVINVVRADLYLAIVGEVEEILFSQGT